MHPIGKAGVLYTELLTMLMTSLVRDADAYGSIKVEVVLHYQSLGKNPALWEHSALRVLYPDSRNKIKTQIKQIILKEKLTKIGKTLLSVRFSLDDCLSRHSAFYFYRLLVTFAKLGLIWIT